MSSFFIHLKWYLCLNGILYFHSDAESIKHTGILTMFNEAPMPRVIEEISYYFKVGKDLYTMRKGQETEDGAKKLALIDPSIEKGDLDSCVFNSYTTFMLSTRSSPKEKVLVEHYSRLSTPYFMHNFILLDEKESEKIVEYFHKREEYDLKVNIKIHTPLVHKFYILTCLTSISLSIITIFYLVCGIYSMKNPIITEFELSRFQVLDYKDLGTEQMESCLICFDTFKEEDQIRILLCKHYFHMECVDRWLCEQSSRCPYCRCTNKYYEEIV